MKLHLAIDVANYYINLLGEAEFARLMEQGVEAVYLAVNEQRECLDGDRTAAALRREKEALEAPEERSKLAMGRVTPR